MPTAKHQPKPVYAVIGADRMLRREALQSLIKSWEGAPCTPEDVCLQGPTTSLASVLDDVRTPSLLGEYRVVVVDDADEFITEHRPALERYTANPAACGTLILLAKSLPANTKLFKAISKTGAILTCHAPKGRAVVAWITQRCTSNYGKQIAPRAATMLRDHVGDAPGALDSELAKVSAYVGARQQIAVEDIESVTGRHREEKVFAITDAMASGDAAAALACWEQVLATDRAALGRSIAGLAWGVRRLLEARRAWDRGASLQQLAPKMFTDPATLRNRLQRTDARRLAAQQRDLLRADLAIKTGATTPAMAVEKFIVQHTAKGGAG